MAEHDPDDAELPVASAALRSVQEALRTTEDALRGAEAALRSADAVVPGASSNRVAPVTAAWSATLGIAAAASLGAGAVHAAAIGAHAEHQQVVKVFTVMAVLQLAWGAVALVRPSRWLSAVGVLLGGAAVVGWIMAKTSGVSFIDGLEVSEPVQWSDGLCAALAAVSAIGAGVHLVRRGRTVAAGDGVAKRPVALERAAMVAATIIAVLSLTGMSAAAGHTHSHGAGDDEASASHSHSGADEGAAHSHDDAATDATDATDAGDTIATDTSAHADHGVAAAVAPVPYDPELPIDLGGIEGVTPQQQARAENLVAITLARLPQFADPATLEAKGFHSIHDGYTGHEHYINWDYINDGRELNPDYPESLVFDTTGPEKQLVSAMFMAEGGVDLDHVPDVGGKLTQWHIHDNLCYTEANPPRVAGLTDPEGKCRKGTRKLGNPVPMIHVWITSHKCGPFSALDGIGAGQVKDGETTACDTAYGHSH